MQTAVIPQIDASKSVVICTDITALLRARVAIIWAVTKEEARVEQYLTQACINAQLTPHTWDCASGTDFDPEMTDIMVLLREVQTRAALSGEGATRDAWILRDAPSQLSGFPGVTPLRLLCNIARSRPTMARESAQAIIILTPSSEIPPELAGHVTVIEWPSPDRSEIAAILDGILTDNGIDGNGARDSAIDAAIGLNGQEAAAVFSKSLVQKRKLDAGVIIAEKKRVISREKVLEWYDPIKGGLDAVGGLDVLKQWLIARACAYSPKARAYGLQTPRGALLVGVPGCGKSLVAKAIATAWNCPLLRLDLNALKSKFVGGSEANLRAALRTIEAIGKCIVWIDEIEKALQGATSGSSDGGVSSDALGTVLSWMQERTSDAFVIATANNVDELPPELMRKGRFDDVWFVDLPTQGERMAIVQASLRNFKRALSADDLLLVARATDRFNGAEVSTLVPDAMFTAFADGERELTVADLLAAAKVVVPASETNKEKLTKLRAWATGRARVASTPDTVITQAPKLRALDI